MYHVFSELAPCPYCSGEVAGVFMLVPTSHWLRATWEETTFDWPCVGAQPLAKEKLQAKILAFGSQADVRQMVRSKRTKMAETLGVCSCISQIHLCPSSSSGCYCFLKKAEWEEEEE